jgi:DNA-binding transcriptional LysR family regulator
MAHEASPTGGVRLPSLDLLRGFEAAARHLSLTRAAEELFLTQSALSKQIITLEEQLGAPLFERRHRQLLLTEAGQLMQVTARRILADMAETAARIRQAPASRPVTLSTSVGFAGLWLVSRLPRFREQHPEVEVFVAVNNRILDLEKERVDLAVRYCSEDMVPRDALRLFGEQVQPVCSPAVAHDPQRPIKTLADLAQHVLLHYEDDRARLPWMTWPHWLAAAGAEGLVPRGALRFSQYDMLIHAAVAGLGVALGRSPLVDDLLAQGVLVAPLEQPIDTQRAYYIVRQPHADTRAETQAFIDWLCGEAKETAAPR